MKAIRDTPPKDHTCAPFLVRKYRGGVMLLCEYGHITDSCTDAEFPGSRFQAHLAELHARHIARRAPKTTEVQEVREDDAGTSDLLREGGSVSAE